MAKNIRELQERRAKCIKEARAIVERAEEEGAPVEGEAKTLVDSLIAEAQALLGEIGTSETANQLRELEAGLAEASARSVQPFAPKSGVSPQVQRDAMRAWSLYGKRPLSRELRYAADACGLDLNCNTLNFRAQGVGDATAGQEFQSPNFHKTLYETVQQFGCMLTEGDVVPSENMETVPYPYSNDVANVGEIVGEHAAITYQDIATGDLEITPYEYSSKYLKASLRFLDSSAFDVASWVATNLGKRIGRIVGQHTTTGNGSGKPYGIVAGAYAGVVRSPTSSSVTYDNIVDMQAALEDSFDADAKWMMNKTTWAYVSKILDGNERPLAWNSGDSLRSGTELTLRGKPVVINRDMDSIGVSKKCILYGSFKAYKVVQVKDVEVVRLNELFMLNHQVGFMAFARFGGRLFDAGDHPVLYFQS